MARIKESVREVNVHQLKKLSPKRFQKEYQSWCEMETCHDWWDCVFDDFKERLAERGYDLDSCEFNLSYSQGDYATLLGRVYLEKFMAYKPKAEDGTEGESLADKYPALYLAIKDDGSRIELNSSRGYYRSPTTEVHESVAQTMPSGVFAFLDIETWAELISEQWTAADLEKEVRDDWESENKDLYRALQSEYDSLTSEENFIQWCDDVGEVFVLTRDPEAL